MSLTTGTYYADPSNKFWDILFMACGEKIEKTDATKVWLLKKYHIALWDVLDSAVRESSSDKDLIDERPNDLPRYLEEYPNIKLLLFHSNGAYKYFKGCYVITVSSNNKPVLVHSDKTPLTDPQELYSGCYGRAIINFYVYDTLGNKGISAGLNGIMKVRFNGDTSI